MGCDRTRRAGSFRSDRSRARRATSCSLIETQIKMTDETLSLRYRQRRRRSTRASGVVVLATTLLMGLRFVVVARAARLSPMRRRAGRSLSSSSASLRHLHGSVVDNGALTTTFALGGNQHFDLIVDTGSRNTYLPCKDCGASCGAHSHEAYDYDASSAFERVSCGAACDAVGGHCMSGACGFHVSYSEGSSVDGYMVRDEVDFGGSIGEKRVAFGCTKRETNLIFNQVEDGLMGFGIGSETIHAQLASDGTIENAFGFCIEGYGEDGGVLTLGKFRLSDYQAFVAAPVSPTPLMSHGSFYTAATSSWSLGGQAVIASQNITTLLDSGTTFTYLPYPMYQDFESQVKAAATAASMQTVRGEYDSDICFKRPGFDNRSAVFGAFPSLRIEYAPSVSVDLTSEGYLFALESDSSAVCLGVFGDSAPRILLGQITMRDTLIEFDVDQGQILMATANCTAFRESVVDEWPDHNHTRVDNRGAADKDGGVLVNFMLTLMMIVGAGFVVILIARVKSGKWRMPWSRNESPWHRLENDYDGFDAEIEMRDVP